MAILAGGICGSGTAAAVKLLATPNTFDTHPFGGVFQVLISEEARWEDRYRMLKPKWVTRDYTAREYVAALEKLKSADLGGHCSSWISNVRGFVQRLVGGAK